VADEQQAAVLWQGGQLSKGLTSIEVAG